MRSLFPTLQENGPDKGAISDRSIRSIPMPVALNDHHPVTAAMFATVPSAMQATVMFSVRKLCARTAKPAVPMHVPVPTHANAELLRACHGRSRHCNRSDCSKNVSQFLHGFLLRLVEKTAVNRPRSDNFREIL
jgi:hypothetical protein